MMGVEGDTPESYLASVEDIQQSIDIYVHRFKAEGKAEMAENFRSKFTTVYNSNKKKLLDKITDPDLWELVSCELPSIVSTFIHYIFPCLG